MEYTGIIYSYYNKISEKYYIGQTINDKLRTLCFFNESQEYTQIGSKIDNARHKYGVSSDIWEKNVLIKIESNDIAYIKCLLNRWEVFYISYYNSFNNGYNSTSGGDSHYTVSDTMREKCKVWLGLTHNYITKGKIRDKCLGRYVTNETREKISKSLKNLDSNNGSITMSKGIIQCDKEGNELNRYCSIEEASRIVKIKNKSISSCLHGRQKYAGGYIWKFIDNKDIKRAPIGYCWMKSRNRWRVCIKYKNKSYVFGTFLNEESAKLMSKYAYSLKNDGLLEHVNISDKIIEYKQLISSKLGIDISYL